MEHVVALAHHTFTPSPMEVGVTASLPHNQGGLHHWPTMPVETPTMEAPNAAAAPKGPYLPSPQRTEPIVSRGPAASIQEPPPHQRAPHPRRTEAIIGRGPAAPIQELPPPKTHASTPLRGCQIYLLTDRTSAHTKEVDSTTTKPTTTVTSRRRIHNHQHSPPLPPTPTAWVAN
jgi:hypothetical protein